MRNIIYCRVSSLKPTSFSFINQEEECVKYCKLNNLRIHQIQKEHISGFGKQKILEQIIMKSKNINLIIYDISRFSRNSLFGYKLLKACQKRNINIHFVKENQKYYAGTDAIELSHNILEGLNDSEKEWHSIRNNTIKSIAIRRKKGLVLGQIPFGFDSINKKLVKNNDFNAIRLIIGLRNGIKSSNDMKEILKKLSSNYDSLNYYDENNNIIAEFTNALTLDFKTITYIFNDYNICGKKWIQSRIRYLYNKYCNDDEFKDDTAMANVYQVGNIEL